MILVYSYVAVIFAPRKYGEILSGKGKFYHFENKEDFRIGLQSEPSRLKFAKEFAEELR